MCKCVHRWSKILIFHLKHNQISDGSLMDFYKDPTWILCGPAAGRKWIPIRILPGSYSGRSGPAAGRQRGGQRIGQIKHHWISSWIAMFLCKSFQILNISLEIRINVFTADPKCKYFIRNICKCVRDINPFKMLIFH